MTTTSTSDLPILRLDRAGFRRWLEDNYASSRGCWLLVCKRRDAEGVLPYVDAVEEALCFGWIDSTNKSSDEGMLQKFTPRTGPVWTELNKERVRRLERLGLMTDAGRAVLPDMSVESFSVNPDIIEALKADPVAWENFQRYPDLYVRVRVGNIQRPGIAPDDYAGRVERFVAEARKGSMTINWNDGGRLRSPSAGIPRARRRR
ncbi:MAG: thymidylate synthase [Thermoplasmata archaeon]|nr:thymidylate synthase [Thermoplasmata archaeon]